VTRLASRGTLRAYVDEDASPSFIRTRPLTGLVGVDVDAVRAFPLSEKADVQRLRLRHEIAQAMVRLRVRFYLVRQRSSGVVSGPNT
jgi:hypothetical protein